MCCCVVRFNLDAGMASILVVRVFVYRVLYISIHSIREDLCCFELSWSWISVHRNCAVSTKNIWRWVGAVMPLGIQTIARLSA